MFSLKSFQNYTFKEFKNIFLNYTAKMKVEKDNCPRLRCEAKANDHWVSFLGYHFNFLYWLESVDGKMQPGIIFERRS